MSEKIIYLLFEKLNKKSIRSSKSLNNSLHKLRQEMQARISPIF